MIEQLQPPKQTLQTVTASSEKRRCDKFMQGLTLEKNLKAGDTFLISFEAKGDIFEVKPTQLSTLKVVQDVFVRFNESDLLLSLDGENWSEFTEAFTGRFGFACDLAEQNPVISAELVANAKQAS